MISDIRYAIRTLVRTPVFTVCAVLILTLGIGANTMVFSALNTLLYRPLPFGDADRLAMLGDVDLRSGLRAGTSLAAWYEWRDRVQSFGGLAAIEPEVTLPIDGGRETVHAARVSTNVFTVLRVAPVLRRDFSPADAARSSADVVIVSAELWQRRFGGGRSLAGRTLVIGRRPHAVIGLLPQGFSLTFAKHDVWLPLRIGESATLADRSFRMRCTRWTMAPPSGMRTA